MATFTTTPTTGFSTALPNIQVANDGGNNTVGNTAALLGDAAIKGYKTYVKYDASNKMDKVLQQFNQDLQAVEEAGNAEEWLNNNFDMLAEQNPEITSMKGTLGNFKTASQQRAGVALLFQLRAESELKKTIRKAPGLRSEIAAAARDTLGFDPSGALVNTLLRGIAADQQETTGKSDLQRTSELVADQLVRDFGIAPAMNQDGTYDYQKNVTRLSTAQASKDAAEQDEKLFKAGQITERDRVDRGMARVSSQYDNYMSDVISSVSQSLPNISNPEEMRVFKEEVIPALNLLKRNVSSQMSRDLDALPVSADGRDYLVSKKDGFMNRTFGVLDEFVAGEEYTQLVQSLEAQDIMMKRYQMNFDQSNLVLTTLKRSMPGLVNIVLESALASESGAIGNFENQMMEALNISSVEDLKKMELQSFTNIIADDDGFNNLSRDQKIASAKTNFKSLSKILKDYDTLDIVRGDYNGIARSLAAAYGTEEFQDRETKNNFIDLISSNNMVGIISDISEFAEDGKAKASVLADRTSDYLYTQVSRNVIPDVMDQIRHPYQANIKYIFDNNTGTLSAIQGETKKAATYFDKTLAPKESVDLVNRFNNSVETLYSLREYSPTLANLSRGELAQVLFSGSLRNAGVTFRGEPMKVEQQQQPVEQAPELVDVLYDISARARELARQ